MCVCVCVCVCVRACVLKQRLHCMTQVLMQNAFELWLPLQTEHLVLCCSATS